MINLMIKENKHKVILILLALLLISSWFYWFQYRPSKIRQSCSWINRHQNATQAQPPKSEEELKKQGLFMECSTHAIFNEFCEHHNRILIEGEPAQPARDWREKASKEEYEFCLHERGLK